LIYIAVNIWRSAGQPLEVSDAVNGNRALKLSFTTALLTQLSNPKTIIVYASLFAALLPRTVPLDLIVALPLGVFAVEAGWYS
ncbi:LysE family transporter, partial [Rhizobium ecuadorense]|uniref:LysE family transporter n=1 Tax=Rhizobium ecuadorense TaxID=1671795 RepID=UPI000AE55E36